MTATQLANHLLSLADQHGDLHVCFWAFSSDSIWAEVKPEHVFTQAVDGKNISNIAIHDADFTAREFIPPPHNPPTTVTPPND